MANATSSSAMNSAPLPNDINFEDLISVNNILSDSGPDDSIVTDDISLAKDTTDGSESETTTAATASAEQQSVQQKVVSLTKIIPKSATTTPITSARLAATVKGANPGQVVIIQGPSGPVPIRIASSATGTMSKQAGITTTSAGTSIATTKDSLTNKNAPVTIQVLKMSDGTLVQLKNNKSLNLTNLSQLNVAGGKPVIVKTTNGPKTVIGTQAKSSSGAPVLKSITLAEAQKAGFLKPKSFDLASVAKLQKMMPTSTASPTTATTSLSAASNASSSSVGTKEVTIKSETDGSTKKIVVPQHMLKVQSPAGNLQAIQIPGKPGLQYVRVVSSSASGTKVVVKKESSPSKLEPPQKLIFNSSGKISSPNVSSFHSKPNVNLIRKIQDISSSKLTSHKQMDPSERTTAGGTTQLLQIKKVNHTSLKNNHEPPVLLNAQIASGTYGKIASSSSQPIIRQLQSIEHQNSNTLSDDSSRPKQHMTLKSPPAQQHIRLKNMPEFTEEQIATLFARRSPTPEALRRKHCNCTKSQCLKLYCDCFANGEFCQDCNCKECFNNLEYEEERQKAIKICLERNPNAFKPKITKAKDQSDLRLHNKGCNCKRSGCLKNYCECYEAKIACSSNCKCFGCRNVEDRSERERLDESTQASNTSHGSERPRAPKRTHDEIVEKPSMSTSSMSARHQDSGQSSNKQPYNFITQDVVDATIQCMIAQADECKKNGMETEVSERMIIEEFGRCLVEIIDFSIRNMDN